MVLCLVLFRSRKGSLVLSLIPASTALWALSHTREVLAGDGPQILINWAPSLGMSLDFHLDVLSWLMTLLVGGIGFFVLAYCTWYFAGHATGLGRFAAIFLAFAGAMLGLVTTDNTVAMYVFWELTTIFSYLLVGHYHERRGARRAALQALIVTTFGGLAMLGGIVVLGEIPGGSYSLTELVANPVLGGEGVSSILVSVAIAAVLVGAITKSALVPFHFWLPGAMAAPTPVSAYLHAAAMVKAGVYLILRMAPALTHMETISVLIAVFGAATMLLGGWRALRQTDIKLLLAYGTVSQLGFLSAVAGLATHDALLAGLAMLIAHSLFKAPLFMVVGVIDKKFGTRDLRVLSGVWKVAPVVTVIGLISAASMAAVPPLFGFVAKESLYTALWYGGGWQRIILFILVAGSVLTVAYSWRFAAGAFGTAPGAPPVEKPAISVLFWRSEEHTSELQSRGQLVC